MRCVWGGGVVVATVGWGAVERGKGRFVDRTETCDVCRVRSRSLLVDVIRPSEEDILGLGDVTRSFPPLSLSLPLSRLRSPSLDGAVTCWRILIDDVDVTG